MTLDASTAPVESAPVATVDTAPTAPVAPETSSPVATQAPAAAPAPPQAAKPEPATGDLLSAEPAPDAEPAGDKPAETAPAPDSDALPSYGEFRLPEGVTVTDPAVYAERIGAFDRQLATLEKTFGLDHEAAAAFRQEAIGMATQEILRVKAAADAAIQASKVDPEQVFASRLSEKTAQWRQEFEDSEFGGQRKDQSLARAKSVIKEFSGNAASFYIALKETGMANHPAMIRLLNNVAASLVEGKPVPAPMAPPKPASRAAKLYS